MSVFAGVKFFLSNRLSMEDHRNLRKIIADQGGQIVEQPGDSKCFHVLPLFTQPDAEAELLQYQKELLPIIGPPCVVEAAERRYQLPDREAVRRSPLFARFLLGAVVCSTAISADMRSALVQRVLWMGGEWHMDFTNTVTHMLAYMPGSEKYKVAVQRGRPALVHPSWVTECWKQQALVPIDQFPVPPFTGLTMTVTGFPHEEREKMKRLCMQHGGQYSSDLNRSCTHLIVDRPGSKKHQYALLWGSVKVVHPRWLYESVEKRACLKEEDFPVMPAESQSQSSANQDAPCSSGTVDSDSQLSITMADPDEAERTRSHSTALKRSRSPAGADAGAARSADSKKRKRAEPTLPVSMSTSRRHDRSGGDDEEVKSSQQPMVRRQRQPRGEIAPSVTQDAPYTLCSRDTMASDGVLQVAGFPGASMLDPATLPPFSYSPFESPSLFKGFSFLCKGFDSAKERSEIKKLVEDHGGVVTFDNPTGASTVSPVAGTYVLYELAPHGTPGVSNQPTGEREPPANIAVTPQWVQRCIQDERVMDPMEMPILFTPLPHPLPLPKPPLSYLISVTGFAGVDRENLKGLIESLGFSYTDRFTKKNTHLICKEASGDKFVKAKEWQRGAIVSAEWLTQSASKGRIQDTKRFAAAQTEDVLSVNRKFEERQRSQAKFNKLSKDRSVVCISDPKPSKERSSTVKSGRRRSSAATSSSSTSLASHGAVAPSEPFLSDVTILVSKKLEQQQLVLHDLVASMGGTFAYMFDPSITHLIFEGRADTSKEFRLAKGHKHIKIVSPLWLHACKRHNTKVDEIEYPHTMNPRMTLGLDFKSPSLVAVKKEKRDPDNPHPAVPQSAAIAVVKREIKEEEEEDLALAFNVDNYYSQQSHYHHQEERDEDLFVPPTQQPSDSTAYRVPLTLQHHRPQPTAGSMTTREQTETQPSITRDESWAVPERSRRGEETKYGDDERRKEQKRSQERSDEEEEEEEDEPLHRSRRERRKATERKKEREVMVEECEDEESTRTNYEVVVGCTPDVRQGGGTTVPEMPPYFWQAGATTTAATTTTIKIEESGFRDDDNDEERRDNEKQQEGVDVENDEEEEEESEGSGHSAIIQQLLQKNKASSTGQMRISPLLRMQPKTSSFMLETISRTVARSDTMLGKEYNRSLSKFSSTMFKPPMSKDILPSQTEEEEDPASESSERRYADEPDSQVVKYAFPLEQAAQDLLFSLAEESMDTEGGASATESASERESRKRKTGTSAEETVQAKAATDGSEHQRGSEAKRRRKDEPKIDDDEAPKDPMDGKEAQQQVTESPWSSRGSGNGVNGSGPNRASGSLDRSLAGKSYIFMFTAFNSTTNKLSPIYVDTVRELGGHVLETKFFHPRCTHVVMAEPVRTEKSLAACAAGIWLLKASYLEECVEKNAFVDESKHIWTEQDTDNEVAQLMIASSRRWRAEVVKRRLELQQAGKKGEELLRVGAFAGWRVLVVHYADVKRGEGLKRLIEAGGGEVCPTSSTLPSGLTMAFFNDRPDESSDLVMALRRAKVPVLTAEYIGDFLTRYPQPPVDRYNFTSPAFAYQRRPRGATGATANSAGGSSVSLLGSGGGASAADATTAASTAAGVKKLATRTVRK